MRAYLLKKQTISFILFFIFSNIFAQNNIKSIQLKTVDNNQNALVVPLGKTLELSFDDIDGDQKEYTYKIEHMTFDWEPSDVFSNEYIDGFQENYITNYTNSFNTLQNYTHYKVQFPNSATKITKSGNYIVSIINQEQQVVFKRRFTLYENKTIIGATLLQKRNTLQNKHKVAVQFTVNYNGHRINNPSQEIEVAIIQNNNWHTAITNSKPQFYKKNQLVYKHLNTTNFWSGNEYLNFDNKQLRASTVKIANSERKQLYHSYLYSENRRDQKSYTYNPDINGQFVIRNIEANNYNTEADYAWVHFSLNSNRILNKKVFVYGAFNNFDLSAENEMTYNSEAQVYEASLLLKQGFYNYTFATQQAQNKPNLYELNGSFSQTENEYTIIVYQKAFGQNYYSAIGIGSTFSNPRQ